MPTLSLCPRYPLPLPLPILFFHCCSLVVTSQYRVQRIKANQIQKLMREEKAVLEEQIQTLHTQVEAQLVVLRKLEEKEQLLQNNLTTVEKELRSMKYNVNILASWKNDFLLEA